ncbi:MAG: RpoL/Rpb11 RNA polymerase subunit family protein [Sulfolobales archaeon]|nr:DNA-directed RNA polymerase subunit L [Sulfolobales archaeon]MDW8082437.1 RpoL/Rpb11 RNA polymerase subunit family protein [Sulfolobales archaeon]
MKIEVRKIDEKELIIKVFGETHTIGNLLAKSALKHPNVKLAAYSIEHPLEEAFILRIITDGSKSVVHVLREVIKNLTDLSDRAIEKFREIAEASLSTSA